MPQPSMAPVARMVSRLAAVALVVCLIALLYGAVGGPLWAAYAEKSEEIARNRLLLGRYMAVSAAPLPSPNQQAGPSPYCAGKTDALVLAGLQGVVQSTAAGQGVTLRMVQPLANVSVGPLTLAGLGLDLTGEFAHIQRFIYAIETAVPTLLIRRAEIHRNSGASPDGATSNIVDGFLHVYCAVEQKD